MRIWAFATFSERTPCSSAWRFDLRDLADTLLHDIGDTLGSYNHSDVAAAILKPFVSPENLWMVQNHGIFQGYYFFHHLGLDRNLRDRFGDQPELFQRTAEFCEKYDVPAFMEDYDALPLSFFEPMVRRVFAHPRHSMYVKQREQ